MITCIFLLLCMSIFKVPPDMIRNSSNDTSVILFCMCVISELHILFQMLKWIGDGQ